MLFKGEHGHAGWRIQSAEFNLEIRERMRAKAWMVILARDYFDDAVYPELRRTGVVDLVRTDALIKLDVRTSEEWVRTTTAGATAPCERMP